MFPLTVFCTGRSSNHYLNKYMLSRFFSRISVILYSNTHVNNNETNYLVSNIEDNKENNWVDLRNDVLCKQRFLNQKNIDGIMLKTMISNKKFEAALSFAEHLKSISNELTLGSINGILALYYEVGKTKELADKEKQFILECYTKLYDKYKVLDRITCDRLLHALCVIKESNKAWKVLEDIYLSSTPSQSAYSTLISTLFKANEKSKALQLIETSLSNRRPLKDYVYKEWIDYILRNYTNDNVVEKVNDICLHISNNCIIINGETAANLKETFSNIGWDAKFTKIMKHNGQCNCCKEILDCLKLSHEEFKILQENVKNKLIIGTDLYLKSLPDELQRFMDFVNNTAPCDIVLDALNIAYGSGKGNVLEKINILSFVVDYFVSNNKKVLLLGRKHMLKWPKKHMNCLLGKIQSFFIDDLSQDDPYFITATVLSGSQADFVSKDLLRGHLFLLKDEKLRHIFQRWQWQHQWMVFSGAHGNPTIQPPLKFTPCAQKINQSWHLPYKVEENGTEGHNFGLPNLNTWLCLKPKLRKK